MVLNNCVVRPNLPHDTLMVQWKLPVRNFIITEKQQTHTAEFVCIKLHPISFIAPTRRWSNTLWQSVNQFYYRLL